MSNVYKSFNREDVLNRNIRQLNETEKQQVKTIIEKFKTFFKQKHQ